MSKFTITIGALTFRPEPYQSFTVGPLEFDVDIPEDLTARQAYERTRDIVTELQKAEFIKQRDLFWEMHKAVK